MRRRLTDKIIEGLKPKTKRYLVMDATVPGLGVRVSKRKTFVLVARFNGSKYPTRRSLGAVGKITLEQARERARQYHQGVDSRRTEPFGGVCERFLTHIKHQRQSHEVERKMRREFIKRWGDRQIGEITRHDVIEILDIAVNRGSPYTAHALFAYIRRFFNWAIARGLLEHSPCDRLKPLDIIGPKHPRQRVLMDDELRRLWKAAERVGYPYGPLWQLLLVTGQRRGEIAFSRRSEIDGSLLTIPPERFKSNSTHLVPLSPLALSIIDRLPQGEGGYLFSMTGGKARLNGWGKAKRRLDALMGDVEPWRIHDIRRTVRTRLSALRVRTEVAEMVIGHGKKGLARVYDQHQYLDEMREALDLWASYVSALTSEAPLDDVSKRPEAPSNRPVAGFSP